MSRVETMCAAAGLRGWSLLWEHYGSFLRMAGTVRRRTHPASSRDRDEHVVVSVEGKTHCGKRFPVGRYSNPYHVLAGMESIGEAHNSVGCIHGDVISARRECLVLDLEAKGNVPPPMLVLSNTAHCAQRNTE